MNTITPAELETLTSKIYGQVLEKKQQIRLRVERDLVGRQVEHTIVEDADHAGGFVRTPVLATIVGTRWTYSDELLLKVTFVHPSTGETVESESPMY